LVEAWYGVGGGVPLRVHVEVSLPLRGQPYKEYRIDFTYLEYGEGS